MSKSESAAFPTASIVKLRRAPLPGFFVEVQAAEHASDTPALRGALLLLERLRGGWRPDEKLLAAARSMERWTVTRRDGAPCQFVGYAANTPNSTSTIIASVLALDPAARWALLFPDRWIVLGKPAATQQQPDAAGVLARARAWLLEQLA